MANFLSVAEPPPPLAVIDLSPSGEVRALPAAGGGPESRIACTVLDQRVAAAGSAAYQPRRVFPGKGSRVFPFFLAGLDERE